MTPTVLVVGAGPTGLALTCELARHGVACRIVDKAAAASAESKALAIQARTLEVFTLMGVADAFLERGVVIHAVSFHAGAKRLARLTFDGLDSPYPFVLSLAQSETERILDVALHRRGGQVERQVELIGLTQDDDGATVQLRHYDGRLEPQRAAWVVGCDGAHSAVRHQLGLTFAGATYEDAFVLADLHVASRLPADEFHLFAAVDGLLGFFSLGGGRHRIIASNPPAAWGDAAPSVPQFQALVDARAPIGAKLHDALWTTHFRIHRRKVARLRVGRVFLAGDAAHIHSPAGGQGMNTGIQDSVNLAWKLALVARGAAKASILDSYEAERLPVDAAVIRQTDLMTRIASLRNPVLRAIRNGALSLAGRLPQVQRRFRANISQIDIAYSRTKLATGDGADGGPSAGERAPDAVVSDAASRESVSLYALFAQPCFSLLLFDGVASDAEPADMTPVVNAAARYGHDVQMYSIQARADGEAKPGQGRVLIDRDRSAHRRYGAGAPCIYLVRPDGYIGHCGKLRGAEAALQAYLARIFGQ